MASLAHSPESSKTPSDGKPRAVIYDRVSTTLQARAGYSAGERGFQVADCRRLADELGAEVVTVIEDTDSGAEWDLDGLNRVLDLAKRREFDILICQDPDRLARGLAKQLVIEEELKRAGVALRFCTLRVGDSPEDRLLKNVRGAVSEYEREKIAFRMHRGIRQKATLGLYVGSGPPPTGYRAIRRLNPHTNRNVVIGLEPDPVYAPIVQRLFADSLRVSLADLARQLDGENVPPPENAANGQRWHVGTIRRILRNPVYKGQATFGRFNRGRQNDPSTWITVPVPPLVDERTWEAVQDVLDDRRQRWRRRVDEDSDPFLLRGLLTCGRCGYVLASHLKAGPWRYYYCARREAGTAKRYAIKPCTPPPD